MIGFAVVAYCRTTLHSNVRGRLTDHIDVPAELIEIHDEVRTFRNATIAHSQSELSVTYPVGVLDAATLEVANIAAVTVGSTLPWLLVQKFRTLVAAMEEGLDGLSSLFERGWSLISRRRTLGCWSPVHGRRCSKSSPKSSTRGRSDRRTQRATRSTGSETQATATRAALIRALVLERGVQGPLPRRRYDSAALAA